MDDFPTIGMAGAMGGQSVPSGGDPAQVNEGMLKQQAGASAQGTEKLAPMKPHTPKSSLGTKLGLATMGMFVPMLGAAVQSHIKEQKEAQINEAVNDFSSLDGALEMASTLANQEAAAGKLPQNKVHERTMELWKQQPGYRAMFDPNNKAAQKRLKNFSKVFQVDWMNPEKNENTVHYQALQRFLKLKPAAAMVKFFGGKADEHRQGQQGGPQQGAPQGQPQGPQPQGGQAQGAPQQPPSGDQLQTVKGQPDFGGLEKYGQYLKALADRQNHFEFHTDENGKSVAFDRRTGQAKDVQVDGKPIAMLTGKKDGVATVDNKPFGMYRNGKVRTPGDPNWTGEDQKQFDAAQTAWAAAESNKDKRMQKYMQARASWYASMHPAFVYDSQDGAFKTVSWADAATQKDRYAPPAQAMQVRNREALFNEIQGSGVKFMNEAITRMGDQPFDEDVRAKLVVMLRSEDPKSYWQDLLKSNVADKLSDAQVDYVTAIVNLDESALSLRSLGGMGQGSDQLRNAIIRMLPGAGTPSGAYAQRQMKLFEAEVKQLKSTLPALGKGDKNEPPMSLDDTLDKVFGKKPN